MNESFVVLAYYQDKEYGEVEESVERAKFRLEEWMEHDVELDEMQVLYIKNHQLSRYTARDFLAEF